MESNYEFNVSIDYRDYPKDKVYVVRYKDFPNVIGAGESIEEAIAEAQGNLEVYLNYCKEEGIDPTPYKDFEKAVYDAVPITKKIVDGARKEQKLKEALLILVLPELQTHITSEGRFFASYDEYVKLSKSKYPNIVFLNEEDYNLVKEALEKKYGKRKN